MGSWGSCWCLSASSEPHRRRGAPASHRSAMAISPSESARSGPAGPTWSLGLGTKEVGHRRERRGEGAGEPHGPAGPEEERSSGPELEFVFFFF
jgi:hypothetical protein